jgi:hypothetical protein
LLHRAPLPTAFGNERVDLGRYLPDGLAIHPPVLPEESGFSIAYHHGGGGSKGIQLDPRELHVDGYEDLVDGFEKTNLYLKIRCFQKYFTK